MRRARPFAAQSRRLAALRLAWHPAQHPEPHPARRPAWRRPFVAPVLALMPDLEPPERVFVALQAVPERLESEPSQAAASLDPGLVGQLVVLAPQRRSVPFALAMPALQVKSAVVVAAYLFSQTQTP